MYDKEQIIKAVDNVLRELFCKGKKGEEREKLDKVVEEFVQDSMKYSAIELDRTFNSAEDLINIFDAYLEVRKYYYGPTIH